MAFIDNWQTFWQSLVQLLYLEIWLILLDAPLDNPGRRSGCRAAVLHASPGLSPANKDIEINHVIGNANMVPIKNIELLLIPRPPKVYQA